MTSGSGRVEQCGQVSSITLLTVDLSEPRDVHPAGPPLVAAHQVEQAVPVVLHPTGQHRVVPEIKGGLAGVGRHSERGVGSAVLAASHHQRELSPAPDEAPEFWSVQLGPPDPGPVPPGHAVAQLLLLLVDAPAVQEASQPRQVVRHGLRQVRQPAGVICGGNEEFCGLHQSLTVRGPSEHHHSCWSGNQALGLRDDKMIPSIVVERQGGRVIQRRDIEERNNVFMIVFLLIMSFLITCFQSTSL